MIGNDFFYNGTWLSEYEMMMCTPEETQQFVSRNFNKAEITSLRAKPNHYGTTYSDVLTLYFFIMKNDALCSNQSEYKLSGDDIHYLRSWLESPKRPVELTVPLEEDEITTHYFGVFTSVQPFLIHDECYGLSLTFTCNAPYGYSDEISQKYLINGSSEEKNGRFINLSAELNEYLRPIITITSANTFGNNESIEITNISDGNKVMEITLPSGESSIIIDCQKKTITNENNELIPISLIGLSLPISNNYSFVSADTYIFYWLSLVPDENRLKIKGSASNTIKDVEIHTRYIVKSGGF